MSSFNPAFAIAAAHGITARTIATWSPTLSRSPRVLVPIQVDALAVRAAGQPFANCAMTVPAQGSTNNTRSELLPPPFQNLADGRPAGMYLHWALPDGLTAGSAGSDTSAPVFPTVPNRWLVLRVFTSVLSSSRRTIAGWILRAGDAIPQSIPLETFTEDNTDQGTLLNPLTALGHGDMAWAAYYDNVVNRLAFYDPLDDTISPEGPLAYLVCGWYTDPSLDPLGSKINSLSDFDARMAQYGWELAAGELQESANHSYDQIVAANRIGLPVNEAYNLEQSPAVFATVSPSPRLVLSRGIFVPPVPYVSNIRTTPAAVDPAGQPQGGSYTTDGSWWPKMTLYHGSVVAIGWPGPNLPGSNSGLLAGQVGGPPPASQISTAVGSTMAEALGAMIAKTNGASDAADQARALEAFMSGSMADLDLPDGAARVDARLHADSFGSLPDQPTTEDIVQPPTPDVHPLPTPPSSLDPGVFAGEVTAIPSQTPFRSPVTNTVSNAMEVNRFVSPELLSERSFVAGGLLAASGSLSKPPSPAPTPSQTITVNRSAPRFFFPSDPVFLVQNADRSYKHGYDGRFSEDGNLICRLSGFTVTELSCADQISAGGRFAVSAADVLDRGVENGSVPPDCEDLLKELILLDPGSAYAAANVNSTPGQDLSTRIQNLQVEQTSWWATRDSRVDQAPLTALSGLAGMLPSPIAINPPVLPWTPLHLDWSIQFIPSANGVSDWVLDEIDFAPGSQSLPDADDTTSGVQLSGRVHLTSGAPAAIASSVRVALALAQRTAGSGPLAPNLQIRFNSDVSQVVLGSYVTMISKAHLAPRAAGDVSPIDRTALADLASSLENMDVLTGALDNFRTKLRAGVQGDGKSTPSNPGVPTDFIPIRAGFMRILRLRIVDGFGQFVDLAGSNASTVADPTQLITSQPMQVPGRNDILALPPRFTSPTRVWFRYQDAAGNKTDAGATVSPVCGFLLPNHLDGDLEFFDASGSNLGDLRPDPQAGIIWEDSPGTPAAAGKSPSDVVSNPFMAGVAQGLISWGFADISLGQGAREDALSALLRIIDSTLWSVDPYAHSGDEHLALLIGHPVVVMRGVVRVEVSEPVAPATVNQARVPVRLGALTHWQDGLFGYFVNDDYQTLYCADQAVAGFARDVGPGQGFLRPINLVPNFYQTFSDDLASPNQFTYSSTAAPAAAKAHAARADKPASASALIPMVTGISPVSGALAGSTTVTIAGINFTGVTAVNFGSTPATSFTFVSDSEVTAVSPAGTGNVAITITTPVGTSASKGTVTEGDNPVTHPYVNTSGVVLIPPNQDVPVTLLVEPHSFVHATTGITPRKEIGMRREWVASALSNIAPTFRFGPVLMDPQRIRMPIPNDIHGAWSWDHRSEITAWSEDKVINTTGDALIPPDPAKAQEGWLRMQPQAPGGTSGSETQ